MKKIIAGYVILICLLIASLSVTYAAFSDKGKYTGSTFNVATTDLKLLNDITLGTDSGNLVDEKPGPTFNNVTSDWWADYPIKIYNNASTALDLISYANYTTANDPRNLRESIYCEIFEWNDNNANGIAETEEIGNSVGSNTILRWKNDGQPIGIINMGEVKGYILRFWTTSTFSSTNQGERAVFDFEFHAIGKSS